jgi:hypothetical protein
MLRFSIFKSTLDRRLPTALAPPSREQKVTKPNTISQMRRKYTHQLIN